MYEKKRIFFAFYLISEFMNEFSKVGGFAADWSEALLDQKLCPAISYEFFFEGGRFHSADRSEDLIDEIGFDGVDQQLKSILLAKLIYLK